MSAEHIYEAYRASRGRSVTRAWGLLLAEDRLAWEAALAATKGTEPQTAAQAIDLIERARAALDDAERLLCSVAPGAEEPEAARLARLEAVEWLSGQNSE